MDKGTRINYFLACIIIFMAQHPSGFSSAPQFPFKSRTEISVLEPAKNILINRAPINIKMLFGIGIIDFSQFFFSMKIEYFKFKEEFLSGIQNPWPQWNFPGVGIFNLGFVTQIFNNNLISNFTGWSLSEIFYNSMEKKPPFNKSLVNFLSRIFINTDISAQLSPGSITTYSGLPETNKSQDYGKSSEDDSSNCSDPIYKRLIIYVFSFFGGLLLGFSGICQFDYNRRVLGSALFLFGFLIALSGSLLWAGTAWRFTWCWWL